MCSHPSWFSSTQREVSRRWWWLQGKVLPGETKSELRGLPDEVHISESRQPPIGLKDQCHMSYGSRPGGFKSGEWEAGSRHPRSADGFVQFWCWCWSYDLAHLPGVLESSHSQLPAGVAQMHTGRATIHPPKLTRVVLGPQVYQIVWLDSNGKEVILPFWVADSETIISSHCSRCRGWG